MKVYPFHIFSEFNERKKLKTILAAIENKINYSNSHQEMFSEFSRYEYNTVKKYLETVNINNINNLSNYIFDIESPNASKKIDWLSAARIIKNHLKESEIFLQTKKFETFDDDWGKIADTIDCDVILENLRSSHNVGSIIRTMNCFGLNKLHLSGYTPTPDHVNVANTSQGCSKSLEWQQYPDTSRVIEKLRHQNLKIIALEVHPQAKNINNYNFHLPCAIILGNERSGIRQDTLNSVDEIIEIPMFGNKASLNVANAFAIIANMIRNSSEKN